MTSQSHRKRRTIRWNIPQTVTTELRGLKCLAATLFFVVGTGAFAADAAPGNSQADRPAALDPEADQTLRQSRELFNGLRATWHDTARTETAAKAPTSVLPIPVVDQTGSAPMTTNEILPASGAGIVKIPDLLPTPTDAADDANPPQTSQTFEAAPQPMGRLKKIQKFTGLDGTLFKRNNRKGTTKIKKPSHGKGKLIEFYDPELERLDVDDYDMPLLLVGASEETEAVESAPPEPSDEQVGLLTRKLSDIKPTLDYAWGQLDEGDLPVGFHDRVDNGPYTESFAPRTVVQWAPTNLWYHPLYFQDVGLERYGHAHRPWIQPFASSGKFFGQVLGLPYQMVLHPPKSREFVLGYYRPGDWAPKKRYQIPFNEEAAATEFLWVTGFLLLIP